MNNKKYKVGYTTGVFDLFHIGHLNILKKSKELCEYLIVGISTDELVQSYKNKTPVIPFYERMAIVDAIKYVDEVISQESLDKMFAWKNKKFDVIFCGDDWKGTPAWSKYEQEFKSVHVDIVYFSYTEGISSTMLRTILKKDNL